MTLTRYVSLCKNTHVLFLFCPVGFESILEGIYGPMLLRDLNLFDGGFLCVSY